MLQRAFLAFSVLALATACSSGGGGEGGPTGRITPADFPVSTNKIDNMGGEADYARAGQRHVVNSGYFSKYFNEIDLDAVMTASIYSTAIYGKRIGANLYSVAQPTVPGQDSYSFAFLPEPDETAMDQWKQAAQGGADMGGTLQGLYFYAGSPTVMIRQGSDRWTLVHELMHYNFDTTRRERNQNSIGELERRIQDAQAAFDKHMKDYNQLPNRSDLGLAADDVDRMIKNVYQRNVDTFLEEVTVESMLIDRFFDGRLKFVDPQSAQSGVWYITQSKETALADFQDYGPLLDKIEKLATDAVWIDIADKMKADRQFIEALKIRIDEVVAKAKAHSNGMEETPKNDKMASTANEAAIAAAFSAMTNQDLGSYANDPLYRQTKQGIRELVEKYH